MAWSFRARLLTLSVVSAAGWACSPPSQPLRAPGEHGEVRLWCTYVYDGVPKRTLVLPTRNPYRAPILDLDHSFGIKWLYFVDQSNAAHFAVHVYDLAGEAPLPLHESKYEPPFVARGVHGFTGLQLAYRADGDELAYFCSVEAP